MLHRRYREVINDTAFLDAVAANAMSWYDAHLAPRAVAEQVVREARAILEDEEAIQCSTCRL